MKRLNVARSSGWWFSHSKNSLSSPVACCHGERCGSDGDVLLFFSKKDGSRTVAVLRVALLGG